MEKLHLYAGESLGVSACSLCAFHGGEKEDFLGFDYRPDRILREYESGEDGTWWGKSANDAREWFKRSIAFVVKRGWTWIIEKLSMINSTRKYLKDH